MSFVDYCGSGPHTSSGRENKGLEGSMFDLSYSLITGSSFLEFVLFVALS